MEEVHKAPLDFSSFIDFVSFTLRIFSFRQKSSFVFMFLVNCVTFINCQGNREPLSPQVIEEAMSTQPRTFCGGKITFAMKVYCSPEVRAIIEGRAKRSGKTA
jgi:hypothetical protein